MIRRFILAAAFAVLAACATPPPVYTAASSDRSLGYSERQIESNRYFVTYRVTSPVDSVLLQDYALLRAADLTIANGRDWFWVDRRSLDEEHTRSGPSVGVGVGAGSWGGRSGGSVGVGVNFPLGGGANAPRARSATLEIRFGEGPKPDDANAYDARATAENLRARISAPR